MPTPRRALLALLLLVPAASIGTLAGLSWGPGTIWGEGVYFLCKLYLLAFPAFWFLCVDRRKPSFSRPPRRGVIAGVLLGVAIAGVILGAYAVMARQHWIDPAALKRLAGKNHLGTPVIYIGFAVWTTFINALLEEYVWRWFLIEKAKELFAPLLAARPALGMAVPALAAGCFTIHHVLVLSLYFPAAIVVLASAGVFLGGLLWSALYLRYRSIVPAYLAHIPADIAVFAVGYKLIFQA